MSTEMRKKLTSTIYKNGAKLSVLIDESTSVSHKSALVVFLRVVLGEEVKTIFLDLIELPATNVNTIYIELLNCLGSQKTIFSKTGSLLDLMVRQL